MATKKQKVTNVPNLRFQGFKGAWDEKTLGDLSEISSGGTPSRSNPLFWNGDIPWVSTTLIDFNIIYDTEERITEEGLKKSSAKLFPKGSLLMAMYGQGKTRGKIAVLGIEACTNQACASIITNKNILDSLFLFQNLSKRYEEIRDLSNQGGQQNLSGTIIKGIKISFPTLIEQERIAAFLSLIDDRIATQNKIIEQLETLMQGLREKVFTQKMRFRDDDGGEFAEWEGKTLGDVAEITMGQSPESNSYNTEGVGMPLIQGNADIKNRKSNPRNYTTDPTKICEIGDIILTVRAPVGATAKSYHNACIGRGVCSIKNNSKSTIDFLYQYLLDYEPKWVRLEQGSTFTAISGSDIKSIEIAIPSVEEQTKIANLLSVIDEKIEAEKKILVQYEALKIYLLQNLFI